MTMQPSLFDREDEPVDPPLPDEAARRFAVDPANHVVLEASAGTGKTRVLVDRYVRLLQSGVDPRHILAVTFTRKAAAEMRGRVLEAIEAAGRSGAMAPSVSTGLAARLGEIEITTIDGFCFALLREFPVEADVDPAFEVADETEMARFGREAVGRAVDMARAIAVDDETVRLLLGRVKGPLLREALGVLVDRRHVALSAVGRFVARRPGPVTAEEVSRRFAERMRDAIGGLPRAAVIDDGPLGSPAFQRIVADVTRFERGEVIEPAKVRLIRRRLEAYFFTKTLTPRKRLAKPYAAHLFVSPAARRRHEQALEETGSRMSVAFEALDLDVDTLLARGVFQVLKLAVSAYESLLEEHGVLDFAGMLERAVTLLERQEEFARSRLKLQARYHHVLVDEFQDTSRLQWRLIDALIGAWAEGEGVANAPTSIFIVGDRKQSIYRFRHAEASLLEEAAARIAALAGDRPVRQAIAASFRAKPGLLAFVNAVAAELGSETAGPGAWQYAEHDRFPVPETDGADANAEPDVWLVAEPTLERSAAAVADAVASLVGQFTVRDRQTGPRLARPDDIAILFRARAGHQYFEEALADRGVRTYVYKGLGFFDAPEVQDLEALIRFLAEPVSDLAAAALLRSRFARLSDQALVELAPTFSDAVLGADEPVGMARLGDLDRTILSTIRQAAPEWVALTGVLPPSVLVDRIIRDSAFAWEWAGTALGQARANVKKVRALIRRIESRGYVTFDRLAAYFDTIRTSDDSNAVIEAAGAVSLMTIHAAKGLEFPIVFVVNLQAPGRGRQPGFEVIDQGPDGEPEVTFGSTPATVLEDQRDADELRRLLYVALTRARDRLYLASTVRPDGRVDARRRSLAGLLPISLTGTFTRAATAADHEVTWMSETGSFRLGVCRPAEVPALVDAPARPVVHADPAPPVVLSTERPEIRQARAVAVRMAGDVEAQLPSGFGSDRATGTLVHRLFRERVDPAASDDELLEWLARFGDGQPGDPASAAAVRAYRALAGQPELVDLLARGEVYTEVPFSYAAPGSPEVLIRGVVDCLVVEATRATVVELKTGHPRPADLAQAAVYRAAMSEVLDGMPVDSRVFYALASG